MIQCPVPVPVCCMFLVWQNIHIKQDKNGRSLFLENMENSEGKSTRTSARGGHKAGGAPYPREPTVRWLMLFFYRKKSNFMRKIWAKDSPQSELWISGYLRNSEGVESETQKQRDRSNLEGALAPPTLWEPRTRGETLIPSREKVNVATRPQTV